MEHIIDVTTANGKLFRVVYDYRQYLGGKQSERKVVSFYDREYDFTPHGQFVSDYYPETLLADFNNSRGLNLNGGVEEWSVDKYSMELVLDWLVKIFS